jgi:hypothetical protein
MKEEKIYCPIILTECRFENCPYYEEEQIEHKDWSFCFNEDGYEIQDGCTNPLYKRVFTSRPASVEELKEAGITLYPMYENKYREAVKKYEQREKI